MGDLIASHEYPRGIPSGASYADSGTNPNLDSKTVHSDIIADARARGSISLGFGLLSAEGQASASFYHTFDRILAQKLADKVASDMINPVPNKAKSVVKQKPRNVLRPRIYKRRTRYSRYRRAPYYRRYLRRLYS